MSADSASFPNGIEVLVKKASVDPEFRQLLLEHRAEAAAEIGLDLSPSETVMLGAVPTSQLEAIIDRTHVPDEHRRAFLGRVAAAMLAALGTSAAIGPGSAEAGFGGAGSGGIRADPVPTSRGVRPDRPLPKSEPEPPVPVAERVYGIFRQVFPKFVELEKKHAPAPQPADAPAAKPAAEKPQSQQGSPAAETPDRPQPPRPPVPLDTRLIEDLGAKPAQLIMLRKQLQKDFQISIPYGNYGRLKTVGLLVEYIEKAVERRENAGRKRYSRQNLPTQPRLEDQPQPTRFKKGDVPQSFGIRPDNPPAAGGIRPQ